MMTKIYNFTTICLLLLLSINAQAKSSSIIYQDKNNQFEVELIVDGLGVTWGMAFLSTNELIFTQRGGKIGLINLSNNSLSWLSNLPKVYSNGQAGLLDVAISPDYHKTKWIYFTYSQTLEDESLSVTTLARAKLDKHKLHSWQELLVSQSAEETNYHYGSRIAFDHKGHVFFSIGDRGNRPNGQDLTNHAGSILRLKLDGGLPKNNPFMAKKDVLAEIWTYGHRNPQGLFFDQKTEQLWSIEHGPRGGDEINLIKAGKNYGWPVISYGKEYWGPVSVGEGTHKKGMEQPVKTYIPSIAPSGLIRYSGKAFPKWKNSLFTGALKLRHLNRIEIKQTKAINEERLLEKLDERIRCVIEDGDGFIYISADSGKILRLKPMSKN